MERLEHDRERRLAEWIIGKCGGIEEADAIASAQHIRLCQLGISELRAIGIRSLPWLLLCAPLFLIFGQNAIRDLDADLAEALRSPETPEETRAILLFQYLKALIEH
jgi:hypothetical protein